MSLRQKIELDDFSAGLITDLESAKLPKAAASRLENADIRNGFLETMSGVAEANTGLPAGFIKLSEEQIKFTTPTEQDVVLVHGTLSGVHKLYVRPYLSLAGAWVDAWLDLTEIEGPYTDSVISGTTLQSNSLLNSTTADYYKSWIVLCTAIGNQGAAFVTAYNQSTKTLTLSWAIPGMVSANSFFIFRNPVYQNAGLSLLQASSNYRYLSRLNIVDIVTGSAGSYGSLLTPKSDLALAVLNGYTACNDADLNFTGLYLTRKPPASGDPTNTISLTQETLGAGEQEIPVPAAPKVGYVVVPVPVYDGYQEGALFPGGAGLGSKYDGTYFSSSASYVETSIAALRKIRIALTLYFGYANNSSRNVPLLSPSDVNFPLVPYTNDHPVWDRRITEILFYMAEIEDAGSSLVQVVSEWRVVKRIAMNNTSAWSGSGPSYTATIDITGAEWDAAEGIDIADRRGHSSLKIYANADFIATAKKRVAVASIYADQQRKSFVFFSAINSDGFNTPDVIPHTSSLDLSLYGISKILGFVEGLGFYVALGENQIVKIDAATLNVDKNIQARGVSSPNAVISANGLIYFVNLEDIYYYHPAQDVIRSIATGFIREAWRALSTSNKQAAAIGYDKRFEKLVIAAGTTIYTYNLPAAYASDLASDTQAVGSWEVYSVGKTFTRFYTDSIGRCIGIANDGKSYELFSSSVANTMVYEKILGEGNLNLHTLRLTYEASAIVTAKIFDMARNATFPLKTYNFPAQALHKRYDQHKGCQVRKPKLQISAPVGTKISKIEINPQPLGDEK